MEQLLVLQPGARQQTVERRRTLRLVFLGQLHERRDANEAEALAAALLQIHLQRLQHLGRRVLVRSERAAAVMQQHHLAGTKLLEQAPFQPVGRFMSLPIAENARPEHDLVLALLGEIEQVDDSPGRSVINGRLPDRLLDDRARQGDLPLDGFRPHDPVALVHVIVDADRMPLVPHPPKQLRMLLRMGPDDKKVALARCLASRSSSMGV